MNLGEKIKKYRKLFKLTQEELAAKLEISKHTLSKYEQNQRKPNIEMLNKIAKALDVTVNDLMEFEELKKEVTSIEETENLLNILGYELKNIAPNGSSTLEGVDELNDLIKNDKIPIYQIYYDGKLITELTNNQYNNLKENIKYILDYEFYKLNNQ
ncbi:transcriptional regulator, MerR family [Clostridium botulinum C str. Eklund]|nr:transcriptional regulator, MerR family [Clostridium botulinum C str. Eklund]NEZ50207.1 helix-turn-helix transcriptional regulator [Clostridium botulinum]